VIAETPPQVQLQVTVVRRDVDYLEIRGTTTGTAGGRFTLYAARRCSSRKRTVAAHGRFKPGSFRAQLAFSILPVRRGRACYRIRAREWPLVTASRRYRVPAAAER